MLDASDNGFKSRKMIMAYVTMGLITLGWLLGGRFPGLQKNFVEFCDALLWTGGMYVGGSSIKQLLVSRLAIKAAPQAAPQPAKVPAPAAKAVTKDD
jgi:hypothetical protein